MPYEYKVMGNPVHLTVDDSLVAVRFKGRPPHSTRAAATEAAGVGPFTRRYEVPGESLTIVPVAPDAASPSRMKPMAAISALNSQTDVSNAQPVFRIGSSQVVATDRVIVGLDDRNAKQTLESKYSITALREEADRVTFQVPEGASVFELCAKLDGEQAVRYAEPDFVTIGRHLPNRVVPVSQPVLDDPMIGSQYAMRITQADQAWNIQTGDPAVTIAILDEGVDTDHADLANAITGTFDAIDDDSFQEPNPWDGHGTACAGLAAGIGNNGIGIRGVGAGCSLLAVRIAHSEHSGGPWITSNERIARAIDWSWKQGAAVLSNSWGGGPPSNAIAEAFEQARTLGRGGKGCVIVIAGGNDFGRVTFPGTLPDVLTVSASNEYDEIKTPTSRDGENWWGTNSGPEIAVAAPGVHNLTTDISGTAGYAGGDFTPKFNGTSSATPIVAGACGLVLSANPKLTEAQVRDIIRQSADKVGNLPYPGGRNDFFGNGRINVYEAVNRARSTTALAVAANTFSAANAAPSTLPQGNGRQVEFTRGYDMVTESQKAPQQIVPPEPPRQFDQPQFGPRLVQVSALIRAVEARQTFQVDGSGLSAAILDTGLRTTHVDFAGRVPAQRNFTSDNGGDVNDATDGQGHGTNVAGIVAAGQIHTGIAPGANIVPLKVLDNSGSGSFQAIADALDWVEANAAEFNISVVGMSLGDSGNYVRDNFAGDELRPRIKRLKNAGIACVIAAGNGFFEHDSAQGMSYPGIIREAISVGAVYDSFSGSFAYRSGASTEESGPDRITPFSQRLHARVNRNTQTDIFAPGAPVTSSGIASDQGESVQHGTSQATPVIVGVVLLLQQYYRDKTGRLPSVDQVAGWLRNGSQVIVDGDDELDNVANTGLSFRRIDVLLALQACVNDMTKAMFLTGSPLQEITPERMLAAAMGTHQPAQRHRETATIA